MKRWGVANTISIGRMLAVFPVVSVLDSGSALALTVAFWATLLIIWLDGVDGYVARKLGESSASGAVVDILADRTVELLYWVAFAALGWISVWIPLVVLTRGIWVDGLRALALKDGYTAFGQSSLMQSWIGVLLVSSRFSRWAYAVTKAAAFALIIAAHHPQWIDAWPQLSGWALCTSWVAVIFCLLRGLPVLVEARRFL